MSEFHKLTINDIEKVTPNCVTIGFAIPKGLEEKFSFKAGQYVTLKTNIQGQDVRRDYSLCSSPNSGLFRVAVKEVENGMFSKFANNHLKQGDVLEVSSPRGRFIYSPESTHAKATVAFAAGSGITPIMSIVKTVLHEEEKSKMILVYGNKTPEDTIFFSDISQLQAQYPERFFVYFLFSQSQEEDALFGRIEASTVNYIIKNKHKDYDFKGFYLCGPSDMITSVSEVLKNNSISEDHIFFELFTAPVENESNLTGLAEGNSNITIMVDDEETTFIMSQKKSILEAALEKDIDAPYSCQGGICSSCLARLTKGSATMRQNNILTESEVENGLILTCQAHPTTPEIYVDYDDI